MPDDQDDEVVQLPLPMRASFMRGCDRLIITVENSRGDCLVYKARLERTDLDVEDFQVVSKQPN